MFNIVEKSRWYYAFSGVLIALSLTMMGLSYSQYGQPLRIGIDFTGGSIFVMEFEEAVSEDQIREVLADRGLESGIVQALGAPDEHRWQVRTREVTADEVGELLTALEERVGSINRDTLTFDTVEPAVGTEVARAAGLAILVASLIIMVFMWFSFRRVPNAFRYGVAVVAGMGHNLMITFGFYALMGLVAGWEVDALFLTAVLTVIGFSVEDKIVVFDRIRENIPKYHNESYATVVNRSLLETVHRSLATQLNAMFVMIAIIMFGGMTLRPFMSVLLIGMISETYSAIFIAPPLLVVWERTARERRAAQAAA